MSTRPRTALTLLLAGFLLAGSLPIGAVPGHEDDQWPPGPNVWDGFTRQNWTWDDDGLRDLWDVNNDTIFDHQFDIHALVGAPAPDGGHHYVRPTNSTGAEVTTMFRQPVDFESPGLIFWDFNYDFERMGRPNHQLYGDAADYTACDWEFGALVGVAMDCDWPDVDEALENNPRAGVRPLQPTIPYQSALSYRDAVRAGAPVMPEEADWPHPYQTYPAWPAYDGNRTGQPCVAGGPPPNSIPIVTLPIVGPVLPTHPRPDVILGYSPPPHTHAGGQALGQTQLYQNDVYGLFDAIENLQTVPTSHVAKSTMFRYHLIKDELGNVTNGTTQNTALDPPNANPDSIAGPPDGVGVSTGHDGFIFGKFEYPVIDGPGPDLAVHDIWGGDAGAGFGHYCLYGSQNPDGPYYLIGTSDAGGREEYDLANYYNAEGAIDKGGPVVKYFGIVIGNQNMHRITADFTWSPDVRPDLNSTGAFIRPIGPPIAPVRNETVHFFDASDRHMYPSWRDHLGLHNFGPPAYRNTDQDPIAHYRWTFNDPMVDCQGPEVYSWNCLNATRNGVDVSELRLNFSHDKDPMHKFPHPGIYNVCHTVGTDGQYDMTNAGYPDNLYHDGSWGPQVAIGRFTDTVCKDVPIWNYDPKPTIRYAQVDGCVPNKFKIWGAATDPEEDPIVKWNWTVPPGSQVDGHILDGVQVLTVQFPFDGEWPVRLDIEDRFQGIANVTERVQTRSVENQAPSLVQIPPKTVEVGTRVGWKIQAHDSRCDELSYAWSGVPEEAVQVSNDPIRFEWVPTQAGLFEIFYMVDDGEFVVEDSTWIKVVDTGDLVTTGGGEPGSSSLVDNCPLVANYEQEDSDLDGKGDACDEASVSFVVGPDGRRPAAENDFDGDGIVNASDNCPVVPNEDQFDLDLDGIGDLCDVDLDGDGVLQHASEEGVVLDNCAYQANAPQEDVDLDGIGDACDPEVVEATLDATGGGSPARDPSGREVLAGAEVQKDTGPFGFSTISLVLGSILVAAALAGTWLTAEGVRSQKLRSRRK